MHLPFDLRYADLTSPYIPLTAHPVPDDRTQRSRVTVTMASYHRGPFLASSPHPTGLSSTASLRLIHPAPLATDPRNTVPYSYISCSTGRCQRTGNPDQDPRARLVALHVGRGEASSRGDAGVLFLDSRVQRASVLFLLDRVKRKEGVLPFESKEMLFAYLCCLVLPCPTLLWLLLHPPLTGIRGK